MKKDYIKPMLHSEGFTPNQYIAGCALSIVGKDTVKVYCAEQSYITVFTSKIGCTYQKDKFESTADAEEFFSHLFEWDDTVAEGRNTTNNTTSLGWSNSQKSTAKKEIDNKWSMLQGTIHVGGYSGRTHAGYALDYLNGFEEGKAIS